MKKNNKLTELDLIHLLIERREVLEKFIELGAFMKGGTANLSFPCGTTKKGKSKREERMYVYFHYYDSHGKKKLKSIGKPKDPKIKRLVREVKLLSGKYKGRVADLVVEMTDKSLAIIEVKKSLSDRTIKDAEKQFQKYLESTKVSGKSYSRCVEKSEEFQGLKQELQKLSRMTVDEFKKWKREYRKKRKR